MTPKLTENCQSTPERQAYEKLSFSSAAVMNFSQRSLGEVAILVVDGFDACSIHGDELASEQIETLAQDNECTENQAKSGAIVAAEIGDCLEIRLQAAQQPDQLDVAIAFGFQPPARPDAVQISINVKLQQIAGRIPRTSRGRRRPTGYCRS